jgi:hypothetical protein
MTEPLRKNKVKQRLSATQYLQHLCRWQSHCALVSLWIAFLPSQLLFSLKKSSILKINFKSYLNLKFLLFHFQEYTGYQL